MTTPETRLRLRVWFPPDLAIRGILAELQASCQVLIQGTQPLQTAAAVLDAAVWDLELSGPLNAINCLLTQLQKHPITIKGKANPDGDSWHY